MTRVAPALGALLLLLSGVVSLTARAEASNAHRTAVTLQLLPSSGPHTIANKTLVTFHLRIAGLTLDPKHISKAQIPGHGHVQIYLDRVPADAYKTMDMRGIVTVTAASSFSVGFTPAWLKRHHGQHRFLIALARNDNILYRLPPASFNVTVR